MGHRCGGCALSCQDSLNCPHRACLSTSKGPAAFSSPWGGLNRVDACGLRLDFLTGSQDPHFLALPGTEASGMLCHHLLPWGL